MSNLAEIKPKIENAVERLKYFKQQCLPIYLVSSLNEVVMLSRDYV